MGYPPLAAGGMHKHTGCTRTRTCMIGIGPRHDHTQNLRAGSRGGPTTTSTRNVLTFVNTTAIAYTQNSAFLPGSWHHAIVAVFTNVRTLRVLLRNKQHSIGAYQTRLALLAVV